MVAVSLAAQAIALLDAKPQDALVMVQQMAQGNGDISGGVKKLLRSIRSQLWRSGRTDLRKEDQGDRNRQRWYRDNVKRCLNSRRNSEKGDAAQHRRARNRGNVHRHHRRVVRNAHNNVRGLNWGKCSRLDQRVRGLVGPRPCNPPCCTCAGLVLGPHGARGRLEGTGKLRRYFDKVASVAAGYNGWRRTEQRCIAAKKHYYKVDHTADKKQWEFENHMCFVKKEMRDTCREYRGCYNGRRTALARSWAYRNAGFAYNYQARQHENLALEKIHCWINVLLVGPRHKAGWSRKCQRIGYGQYPNSKTSLHRRLQMRPMAAPKFVGCKRHPLMPGQGAFRHQWYKHLHGRFKGRWYVSLRRSIRC